ncbi:hypothetical protein D3C74_395200 [compost metagenome]
MLLDQLSNEFLHHRDINFIQNKRLFVCHLSVQVGINMCDRMNAAFRTNNQTQHTRVVRVKLIPTRWSAPARLIRAEINDFPRLE